eukprot:9471387-Heterocapsa_arctica.AAC.1
MYGAIVRPDLAYVAKELARRLATPSIGDIKRAKRLLRYVKGTVGLKLRLNGHGSTDPELQCDGVDAYADANWGSGATRRS